MWKNGVHPILWKLTKIRVRFECFQKEETLSPKRKNKENISMIFIM